MTARRAEPAHNNEEDLRNNGAGSAGRAYSAFLDGKRQLGGEGYPGRKRRAYFTKGDDGMRTLPAVRSSARDGHTEGR